MENRLNAKDMLEITIKHIEEKYPKEIDQCYNEIKTAADDCKFSTTLDLTSPECASAMKNYFMYKGYNVKLEECKLELEWNVNCDGTDMTNIFMDRMFLRTFI